MDVDMELRDSGNPAKSTGWKSAPIGKTFDTDTATVRVANRAACHHILEFLREFSPFSRAGIRDSTRFQSNFRL